MEPNPQRRFIFHLRTLFVLILVAAIVAKCATSVTIGEYLGLWCLHAIIAAVLSSPVLYFGRHRAKWQAYELLALVLPFLVWAVCITAYSQGKSIANLGECFLISIAIPIAALLRVAMGHRKKQWANSAAIILGLCIVAISIYLFTPSLPE
jgi:hypothetical protein